MFSDFEGELLIFEIYLNNKNEMATTVDLSIGDFTYYKSEEEVLLMPMFTFQVTKITKPDAKVEMSLGKHNIIKASVTTITLVQIPYLDLIKIRPIFENALIWYNINPGRDNQDVNNMASWVQKVSELQCTMEYCRTKEEVFGCVDQS